MTHARLYPSWKEIVVFSTNGPRHQRLMEAGTFLAVLVGLEASQKILSHPATDSAYHSLEGTGWMTVDGERLPVAPGAMVVVPNRVYRGVEAQTQLAFLGTQAARSKETTL